LQVVTGRIEIVSLDGTPVHPHRFEPDGQISTANLGAALFRREAFDRVGMFDESLRFSEDQDWFLRARELQLKILILKETTLIYRRHQGNMTHQKSARDLLFLPVLKKSLDRRRRQGMAGNLPNWSAYDEERKQ
jgi:GT2 family glycosyltransferase